MSPTVSVVMPFRNARPTLPLAVSSILAETQLPFELVAINDGSTDDGPQWVRGIAQQDQRVRLIDNPTPGLVRALRLGISQAASPYIARFDADDEYVVGRLAAQLQHLQSRSDVALVATQVALRTTDGAPAGTGLSLYVDWQNGLLSRDDHAREIFVEAPVCHPSVMFRRAAYEEVGGYQDFDGPEDYDLWLRLQAASHGIEKLPCVFHHWSTHPGQLTVCDPRYNEAALRRTRARYLAPWLHRATSGRDLVVWGAGAMARRLVRELEVYGVFARRFVDIDPRRIGGVARGVPIVDRTSLSLERDFVLAAVGSRGARLEIRQWLTAAGWVEGQTWVAAA